MKKSFFNYIIALSLAGVLYSPIASFATPVEMLVSGGCIDSEFGGINDCAEALFSQAKDAEDAGDMKKAIRFFSLAAYRGHPSAFFKLAQIKAENHTKEDDYYALIYSTIAARKGVLEAEDLKDSLKTRLPENKAQSAIDFAYEWQNNQAIPGLKVTQKAQEDAKIAEADTLESEGTNESNLIQDEDELASVLNNASAGNTLAAFRLGLHYLEAGDYKQSEDWFRVGATQGDSYALSFLSLLHEESFPANNTALKATFLGLSLKTRGARSEHIRELKQDYKEALQGLPITTQKKVKNFVLKWKKRSLLPTAQDFSSQ